MGSVICGSASCKVALQNRILYLSHESKENESNLQRHQTMLHILSLLLLPLLICSAEAKAIRFFLCFGEGCSGWEIVLTVISIIFFTCVLVCLALCACRGCRREMKQRKMEEENSKTSSNIKETV